jgi:1-acyl-sn-glycerol-3-phosphate acyltransferase
MSVEVQVVNSTIKGLTRLLFRIDDHQLARIPDHGPLIMVTNHINFFDIPLLYLHLLPRPVTGFAKSETWNNPALAYLADLWQAIPIKRGEPDVTALRHGLSALHNSQIVAVAPEGTRSGHGCLNPGHPGIVILALKSCAPILPVVFFGNEKFKHNLSHLQRTDFHIIVGNVFHLETGGIKITSSIRQEITDEIMYQIAALLPLTHRGHYSTVS